MVLLQHGIKAPSIWGVSWNAKVGSNKNCKRQLHLASATWESNHGSENKNVCMKLCCFFSCSGTASPNTKNYGRSITFTLARKTNWRNSRRQRRLLCVCVLLLLTVLWLMSPMRLRSLGLHVRMCSWVSVVSHSNFPAIVWHIFVCFSYFCPFTLTLLSFDALATKKLGKTSKNKSCELSFDPEKGCSPSCRNAKCSWCYVSSYGSYWKPSQ